MQVTDVLMIASVALMIRGSSRSSNRISRGAWRTVASISAPFSDSSYARCARDTVLLARGCSRQRVQSRLLLLRHFPEQVHQRLICTHVFRTEARDGAAKISAVELRAWSDFARQKSLSERAVRHEADAQFLEHRQDLLFRSPEPKRIFTLKRGYRLHRMCAAYGLRARFGKSEVFHFSLLN